MPIPNGYLKALNAVRNLHKNVDEKNFSHGVGQKNMKVTHHVAVRLKKDVVHYQFDPKSGAILGKPIKFDWGSTNPTIFKK